MDVLGISALYHDSAAALVRDGRILAAAQEERFTRKKQDSSLPRHAITYCLDEGGIRLEDLDYIAFYDKPFLKFERLLETYLAFAPRGFVSFRKAMPLWLKEKLFQKTLLRQTLTEIGETFDWENRLLFAEHHMSHAASAFFPSPFDEAAVLTMDGVGEWTTTSTSIGRGNQLAIEKEIHFPHSLGLLYSAFTYHCGFRVNSGEYKLMGLAPYGEPVYCQTILDNLIDAKEDGSFRLNLSYFDYCTGLTMTNAKFDALFGAAPRSPDAELSQYHMNMAASIQKALEDVVLRMTRALAAESGMKRLCMAGGVALNCVANGKILKDGNFEELWVQPAAGDAGGALGAALAAYHGFADGPRPLSNGMDALGGAFLGPSFAQAEVERRLRKVGARFVVLSDSELLDRVARALSEGKAVGWFQGRMEFGPRALGGRSILGDPRYPEMQKTLNLKVKFRESFRPFAPSVLREDAAEWFDLDQESPYMLLTAEVGATHRRAMSAAERALFGIDKLNVVRSDIPAVTHIDYSARVQTVTREMNPRFHALLTRFKELTGCPVLINTSFNIRSEPIACTPEDAFRCFMGSDIDLLAVENCVLDKEIQDPALKIDYRDTFEPD